MTAPVQAQLFGNRHRLAGPELAWATRRLTMLDAHHVAMVHGRHGVIEGFEPTAEGGPGGRLIVAPGSAYTACGDLVRVECISRFDPPADPGWYGVWLEHGGRVVAREERLDAPHHALRLGAARAAVWSSHEPDRIRWVTTSPTTAGRTLAVEPKRAHVAAGREQLSLDDVEIDVAARTISRVVVTSNGQFERTPLYFGSFGVTAPLAAKTVIVRWGWLLEICSPTRSTFRLRVHVQRPSLIEQLAAWRAAAADLAIDVAWMGVDPARADVAPGDPACTDVPRPEPTLIL